MAMLERIKKRQLDGFKEFVQNIETTGLWKRQQIITAGVLEDPNYMFWILKNIRTFESILELPSEDLEKVLLTQSQVIGVFAKAIVTLPDNEKENFANSLPRFNAQIRDELSYMGDIPATEIEGARFFLVKTIRSLQEEEKIEGFPWRLPPMDIFYPKTYEDGNVEIYFESGILAATGEMAKNKREGLWTHFYDNGKLLARGHYKEGLKEGKWEFYFGNGKNKAQGYYLDDNKHGLWQEWDRKDKMNEVTYKQGVKLDQSSSN
jgi:hypothetical protein